VRARCTAASRGWGGPDLGVRAGLVGGSPWSASGKLAPDAEKGPVGGIPAPSQDSSVAGGGIPPLRSEYIVHDFTASVKQFLPIADIVDCDGVAPAECGSRDS
jgi:hypothetical protein